MPREAPVRASGRRLDPAAQAQAQPWPIGTRSRVGSGDDEDPTTVRGVRRVEAYRLDETAQLAETVARHDFGSVKASLVAAIELYLKLRADEPPRSDVKGMPQALFDFLGHEAENAAARL